MADFKPKTVGQSLYWSYANLAMAFKCEQHGKAKYQQIDYIVRNKLYHGLMRGKLKLGSFVMDEKWKLVTSDACCYCGGKPPLTVDHLIPKLKGGKHSADNLVGACGRCNSSKKALDLLEWMGKRRQFPSLGLLRRYLKLAIYHCIENGLLDIELDPIEVACSKQASLFDKHDPSEQQTNGTKIVWPFAIELIPHRFPDPIDLVWWVSSEQEQRAEAEWIEACGPELIAAEKHWRTFSASEVYLLAIYQKGDSRFVDVLRVEDAYIQGKRSKTLTLRVVEPKLKIDKLFGDSLERGRDFEIPIHNVLYSEPLPTSNRSLGISDYRQAIVRGLAIAKGNGLGHVLTRRWGRNVE